ncbi:hypothetical protein ACWGVR_14300 [Streptomyces xanthophaeus]
MTSEAHTYVVESRQMRAVKVGWAAAGSKRFAQLERYGWHLHRLLTVADRALAREIEQATLFILRHRLYVPHYVPEEDMPAGGWTETSSSELVTAPELWQIVCEQAAAIQLAPVITRSGRSNRVPPKHQRTKGDSLRHVPAARREAAETARVRQLSAPNQTPKRSDRKGETA